MAVRRPLVIVGGRLAELPAADSTPGGGGVDLWVGDTAPVDLTTYKFWWNTLDGVFLVLTGTEWIEPGSAPASTDDLPEGASNLYFLASRVRGALLDGLTTATNVAIAGTDSVLSALGKLQAQITAALLRVLPTGGGAGQFARKVSANPGDTAWTDILGTVAMAGGVPTGALLESYSFTDANGGGRVDKFASGLMIIRYRSTTRYNLTTAVGPLYVSPPITKAFPEAFIDTPILAPGTVASLNAPTWPGGYDANTTQMSNLYLWSPSNTASCLYSFVAVGRYA